MAGTIKYGIGDLPSMALTEGTVLVEIHQTGEEILFGRERPREGCREGVYEEVGRSTYDLLSYQLYLKKSFFTVVSWLSLQVFL